MEYLPILLRIPEEQYEILITLQSDSLFVYHTVVINKILFERKPSKKPTWATTEVFRATVTNTVMEAARLQLEGCTITQAFKESLLLLFGDSAEITVEDRRESQSRRRRNTATPNETDDFIDSVRFRYRAEEQRRQREMDEFVAEEIRRRQNKWYGNRNQG